MKPYQRGDVVIIDVPIPASGHVQGGKRPWVIVQNNMGNQFSPTSIVVPLTTKMKRLEMPTHVAFVWENLEQSMVECEQVRVIDITEDWKYVCTLPPQIMSHIDTALRNAFFYGGGCNRWRISNSVIPRFKFSCIFTISPLYNICLLYTSPSPRDRSVSRMPSSA